MVGVELLFFSLSSQQSSAVVHSVAWAVVGQAAVGSALLPSAATHTAINDYFPIKYRQAEHTTRLTFQQQQTGRSPSLRFSAVARRGVAVELAGGAL